MYAIKKLIVISRCHAMKYWSARFLSNGYYLTTLSLHFAGLKMPIMVKFSGKQIIHDKLIITNSNFKTPSSILLEIRRARLYWISVNPVTHLSCIEKSDVQTTSCLRRLRSAFFEKFKTQLTLNASWNIIFGRICLFEIYKFTVQKVNLFLIVFLA